MSSEDTTISEKELALIDSFAEKIVNSELDAPALVLLQILRPISRIGGDLAYFYLGAFIPLLDNHGYDFLDTFEKKENVELLMEKVEHLGKERDKIKRKNRGQSLFNKIKKKFKSKNSEE